MDGDYRASDGGPWTECAECGATIPDIPEEPPICAECAAEMAADEIGEGE